jgi:hypothetical protein
MIVLPRRLDRSEAEWRDLLSIGTVMIAERRPLGFARGDGRILEER